MSTSTGPCFVLKPDTDLFAIPAQLEEIRSIQGLKITQEVFTDSIRAFDNQTEELDYSTFVKSWITKTIDSQKNISDYDPYVSHLLSADMLFYKNPVRNEVVVRLIGFAEESVAAFKKLPFIERDVTYHNSSDSQLEEMTEEEWHDRKLWWDEAQPRFLNFPSALSVKLSNAMMGRFKNIGFGAIKTKWDELTLPSYTTRCSQLFNAKYVQTISDLGEDPLTAVTHSLFFKFTEENMEPEYDRLYKHEEYMEVIERLMPETKEQIAQRIVELKEKN